MKLRIPSVKLPTPREGILLALFSALMIVSKEALAFLPNIEIVTLMIILITHNIGAKSLWSVYVFVIVQALIYPSGTWIISYFYVWAILVLVVLAVRRFANTAIYTVIAALFGILFGVLCSVPSFFIGGFGYGISWIISGLSYDLVHCIGNALSVAILFYPLDKALKKVLK